MSGDEKKAAGVCVVIGAGSDGIGGAVAARFAAEGFTTVVSRRKVEPLQNFVDGICASGGTAFAHAADARDEDSIAALVSAAEAGARGRSRWQCITWAPILGTSL